MCKQSFRILLVVLVLAEIMSTAVTAPQFERSSQAVLMAESAVVEADGGQNQQSRMLIAQWEIDVFLNQ